MDYVFDPIVGKDTIEVAARSLGFEGGRIVVTLKADPSLLASYQNVSTAYIYSNPIEHQGSAVPLWTHLEKMMHNGDILPLPYQIHGGLDKTSEAFYAVKKASGYKVIIHPQE